MLRHRVRLAVDEDTSYWLRWDMGAIEKLEELTGQDAVQGIQINVRNAINVLWCALYAEAASRDEEAPITRKRFASLFAPDDAPRLVGIVAELLGYNMPEPKPEKKAPARKSNRAKKSRSRSSTSGARSISASPSASSGA